MGQNGSVAKSTTGALVHVDAPDCHVTATPLPGDCRATAARYMRAMRSEVGRIRATVARRRSVARLGFRVTRTAPAGECVTRTRIGGTRRRSNGRTPCQTQQRRPACARSDGEFHRYDGQAVRYGRGFKPVRERQWARSPKSRCLHPLPLPLRQRTKIRFGVTRLPISSVSGRSARCPPLPRRPSQTSPRRPPNRHASGPRRAG